MAGLTPQEAWMRIAKAERREERDAAAKVFGDDQGFPRSPNISALIAEYRALHPGATEDAVVAHVMKATHLTQSPQIVRGLVSRAEIQKHQAEKLGQKPNDIGIEKSPE